MKELEVMEVNPIDSALTKANLTEQALAKLQEFLPLTINGVDDAEGYKAVDDARKICKNTRVLAEKICKQGREESNRISKAWSTKQNEVVGQIEIVEQHLINELKKVDVIAEEQKRLGAAMQQLPHRKQKLSTIGLEVTDEELLKMDDANFFVFFSNKHDEYIAKQQAKLKEAEEALQKEIDAVAEANAKASAEIQRQQELQDVAERAAAKARQDAEEEYQKKIRDEQAAAIKQKEFEENEIREAQKRFEERVIREAQEKIDAEIKRQKDLADAEAKRIADEEAAKKEEQRRLAAAPDVEKLSMIVEDIKSLPIFGAAYKVTSPEAIKTIQESRDMLSRVIQFIEIKKQKL